MSKAEELFPVLKELIVVTLALEDVSANEIDTDAPLFIEGLGLDSIDALELAMALEEQYGVMLDEDPERNQEIFGSVRNLAEFVAANQPG